MTEEDMGFFEWVNVPLSASAIQIIPGLLRRIQVLEEENNTQKKKEKRLFFMLGVAVCLILWMMY